MKLVCPNCDNLIEVNPDRENTYCNKCSSSFPYDEVKNWNDKNYSQLINSAYRSTFQLGKLDDGYKQYEQALHYRPNDLTALTGMCLNRLIGQTFKNPQFKNIIDVLEAYEIELDKENTFIFLSFVLDTFNHIRLFINEANKRLTNNNIFISEEAFDLYILGINQIDELLKYYKDALNIVEEEEFVTFVEDNPNFKEEFKTLIKDIDSIKSNEFKVNGIGVVNFDKNIISEEQYDLENTTIDNYKVLLPNKKFTKKALLVIVGVIGFILATIVMLIVGLVIKNNLVIGLSFVPLGSAIILLVLNKKLIK